MLIVPVTLEGLHVRLEPLSSSHVTPLTEIGVEPEIWRWMTTQVRDRDAMQRYVDEALAAQLDGMAVPFATVERASNRVVGSTRFGNIDRSNRRAEIGWTWIHPKWQRGPINTEAKLLMLRHAFEVWGCIRVEFKTDALNDKSRAALLRIGAKEEGMLRKHMIADSGRIRDSVYYSVLDTEWPGVKAALEKKLQR
jgi:RimJ/RimL family protein N-acetyltransferase